jgi:2-phosphosulfolactate phosphatase
MPSVDVDCFFDRLNDYGEDCTIVAVDVIRSTSTAVTGVDAGRRCFPAPSLEAAMELAEKLDAPLLVGELGGSKPYGFDLNNSPAALAGRSDVGRPMVLLSTSGTRLMCAAGPNGGAHVACLRNWTAQAERLAEDGRDVALVGAGTRGEFREEDQLCCAWIAHRLLGAGFAPANEETAKLVDRWVGVEPADAFSMSRSTEYLRATGQVADLDFILAHQDDIDAVFVLAGGEVVRLAASG